MRPLALLLTLGASQFYFGYVESYPIALVFVLLFLWLGLRAARGASPVLLAGVALAAAGAAIVPAQPEWRVAEVRDAKIAGSFEPIIAWRLSAHSHAVPITVAGDRDPSRQWVITGPEHVTLASDGRVYSSLEVALAACRAPA